MKIIVGLGNPGKKFEETRHNVGFMAVEEIKKQEELKIKEKLNFKLNKKFNAEVLEIKRENQSFLLVKPQTFMNKSGEAVKKIIAYYKTNPKNLYVIHDDLDIALGKYKFQFGRGAAGHKGVESIIIHLKTKNFWRIRVGIGREKKVRAEDYVLEKFSKEEKKKIKQVIKNVMRIKNC